MLKFRFGIKSIVCILAIAITVLAYETAEAQRKGGGRGRGGRFGVTMVMLAQNEKVQEELKITDQQREEIEKIADACRGDMQDLGSGLENLSGEERQKKFEELAPEREKITAEAEKKLVAVLKEDQVQRLKGILIQGLGVRALVRADVAEVLKLTDDQKKQIKGLIDSEMSRMAQSAGDAATDKGKKEGDKGEKGEKGEPGAAFARIRERMAAIRKQNEEEIKKILTPEQQKQLAELKGAKFEIQFGGGRGRRGGGGGN